MNPNLKTALYVVGALAVAFFVWRMVKTSKSKAALPTAGTGAIVVPPDAPAAVLAALVPTIVPGSTGAVAGV